MTCDVTESVCNYKLGLVLFFLVGYEKKAKLSLGIEVGASDSVESNIIKFTSSSYDVFCVVYVID